MVDPIRDTMKNGYREGRFSTQKKHETIEKIRRKKKHNLYPYIAMVLTSVALITLTFRLINLPTEQQEVIVNGNNSSTKADQTVTKTVEERVALFTELVKLSASNDSKIEKIDELRNTFFVQNDWLLQRAIETGNSLFYESPDLSKSERASLIELLQYMNAYVVKGEEGIPEVYKVFSENQAFRDVVSNSKELKKTLANYVALPVYPPDLLKPQKFTEKVASLPILTLGSFILFVLLFVAVVILTISGRRRNWIFFLPLVFLVLGLIGLYNNQEVKLYGDDETMMLQSISKALDIYADKGEPIKNIKKLELVTAAAYLDKRVALAKADDQYILASFGLKNGHYVYEKMKWGSNVTLTSYQRTFDGEDFSSSFFNNKSNVVKVKLENKGFSTFFQVEPKETVFWTIPSEILDDALSEGYFVVFYDGKGKVVD
ncbi:hypothetical protein ACQKM9_16445 [Viridibacillus sp. NPDC093762]|uniref:hypothetical protein n=1 Tax=Viridibacillus sp. NPDC093762 TaxID=3390720 RepID=UPI003CFDF2AB